MGATDFDAVEAGLVRVFFRVVEQQDIVKEGMTPIGLRYLGFDHQLGEVVAIDRYAKAMAQELALDFEAVSLVGKISSVCGDWLSKADRNHVEQLTDLRSKFRNDLLELTQELAEWVGVDPPRLSAAPEKVFELTGRDLNSRA